MSATSATGADRLPPLEPPSSRYSKCDGIILLILGVAAVVFAAIALCGGLGCFEKLGSWAFDASVYGGAVLSVISLLAITVLVGIRSCSAAPAPQPEETPGGVTQPQPPLTEEGTLNPLTQHTPPETETPQPEQEPNPELNTAPPPEASQPPSTEQSEAQSQANHRLLSREQAMMAIHNIEAAWDNAVADRNAQMRSRMRSYY